MSDVSPSKIEFSKVKARWPIMAYALYFASDYKFVGLGWFRVGKCPWAPECDMVLSIADNTYQVFSGSEIETGDVLDWEMHRSKLPDRATAAAVLAAYEVEIPWN